MTKIKIAVSAIVILLYVVLSVAITNAVLKDLDTKIASNVAMEQMNIEGESEEVLITYESYRNIRNDIVTYSPIITIGVIVITIVAIFVPEIVGIFMKKEG